MNFEIKLVLSVQVFFFDRQMITDSIWNFLNISQAEKIKLKLQLYRIYSWTNELNNISADHLVLLPLLSFDDGFYNVISSLDWIIINYFLYPSKILQFIKIIFIISLMCNALSIIFWSFWLFLRLHRSKSFHCNFGRIKLQRSLHLSLQCQQNIILCL